ncbi:hypothetical protein Dimus_016952 [Dionaea muscipula]
MEDFKRCHVPAFGSWDYTDDLPFTQCFESARQAAGLLRYGYSSSADQDRDLYVAGDLYEDNIVTPAVIVVPRRRRRTKRGYSNVKETEKQGNGWGGYEIKKPPSQVEHRSSSSSSAAPAAARKFPKAVDEDLYKIPPELLSAKVPKRKRGFGLFSSCLMPVCA